MVTNIQSNRNGGAANSSEVVFAIRALKSSSEKLSSIFVQKEFIEKREPSRKQGRVVLGLNISSHEMRKGYLSHDAKSLGALTSLQRETVVDRLVHSIKSTRSKAKRLKLLAYAYDLYELIDSCSELDTGGGCFGLPISTKLQNLDYNPLLQALQGTN